MKSQNLREKSSEQKQKWLGLPLNHWQEVPLVQSLVKTRSCHLNMESLHEISEQEGKRLSWYLVEKVREISV